MRELLISNTHNKFEQDKLENFSCYHAHEVKSFDSKSEKSAILILNFFSAIIEIELRTGHL